MLDNGRKTIGLFVLQAVDTFQKRLCRGAEKRCLELGYNVITFSSFGNFARDRSFFRGEKAMVDLPDYSSLSGVIIASDTFDDEDMKEEVVRRLKEECKGPVVSIRGDIDTDYRFLLDDTKTMDRMINHFIEDHGFRDICFMTGTKGMPDAELRLQNFIEQMEKHNLHVDESMYYYGDFWRWRGKEACAQFIDERRRVPEAIICANDYMGISVCNELERRGIRVPEDVAVCGCDGLWETLVCTPTLSTIEVDFEEMGRKAVDAIHSGLDKKEVYFPMKDVLRESCGCGRLSRLEELHLRSSFYEKYQVERQNNLVATYHSIALEMVNTREELADCIQRYLYMLSDCKRFHICLQDNMMNTLESIPYGVPMSDEMDLVVSVSQEGDILPEQLHFERKSLLPKEVCSKEPMILYVMPFHFKERNLGYTVAEMKWDSQGGYPEIYQTWMTNLANAIQDLFNRTQMNHMIDSLEELSVHDPMTGVYNRYGFEQEGKDLFEGETRRENKVFFMSIDLDGLKTINDKYGHGEGDKAIRVVTKCLKQANHMDAIIARMGGDEFNVIGCCKSEADVKKFIKEFEKGVEIEDKKHEYTIHASVGYFIWTPGCNMEWQECMLLCDNRMYVAKRSYKK